MTSSPFHCVLLGAAGTGTAFGAAAAIRRRWDENVRIIAMDINPQHLVTCSLLANHFEQVSPVEDGIFSTTLLDLIEKHQIDTYLPLLPEEITLSAKLRDEKRFPEKLKVLAPSLQASQITSDKYQTSIWLQQNGIFTPKTSLATNPFGASLYFFKPKNGRGSLGTKILSPDELPYVPKIVLENGILQDICESPEVTVDVFFDARTDFVAVICRERLEVKSGVSTKARLFTDNKLVEIATHIAKKLPISGSFCFQAMRYKKQWAVTDINARPGAATAMCNASGNDFFAATFAYAWNDEVSSFFTPLDGDIFVTRQYSEFRMY